MIITLNDPTAQRPHLLAALHAYHAHLRAVGRYEDLEEIEAMIDQAGRTRVEFDEVQLSHLDAALDRYHAELHAAGRYGDLQHVEELIEQASPVIRAVMRGVARHDDVMLNLQQEMGR